MKQIKADKENKIVTANFVISGGSLKPFSNSAPIVISDNEEYDDMDEYIIEGNNILERLIDESLDIDKLTQRQVDTIVYYFYKLRKEVRRAVNLRSRIPLSVIQVIRPKVNNPIVQDAVFNWYDIILNRVKFKHTLLKVAISMNLFGRAYVIIHTDGSFSNKVFNDIDEMVSSGGISISDDDRKKIDEIVDKYYVNPDTIPQEDIDFVVKKIVPTINDFSGIKVMSHQDILDIVEERSNNEIDYHEVIIPVSYFIKETFEIVKKEIIEDRGYTSTNDLNEMVKKETINRLSQIGYSKSFVLINCDAIINGEENIVISNDINEDCFIIKFELDDIGKNSNPILSVLQDLINLEIKRRKEKKYDTLADKNIKLISSQEANIDQLETLINDIQDAVVNADYSAISVNYGVSIDDIDFSLKDQVNPDDIDSVVEGILAGLGIPQSFFDASDTYGSSFIQIQTLNVEMKQFVDNMTHQMSEKLFRPLSIKKGLIQYDRFGNASPIVPRINFYKGSVMVDDYIDKLTDLAGDGLIGHKMILENIYGFDFEESLREVKKEQDIKEELGIE